MRKFLAIPFILLAACPAWAGDIATSSRVVAATVFPRGADITRQVEQAIPAGNHVLVLKDFPAQIVKGSIRVEGDADGELVIGSVDSRIIILPIAQSVTESRKEIEDEIEQLQDRKAALADVVHAAETQRALMANLAELPRVAPVKSAEGERSSPEQWGQLFDLIGQRTAAALAEIQEARLANRALDRKIEDLQRQLAIQPPLNEQRTQLQIAVNAAAGLNAKLKINYQVPGASWSPVYEGRLETGSKDTAPSLVLHRRARVVQHSDEDWNGIALTLSTTQPQKGTAAPTLNTVAVRFAPKRRKRLKESTGGLFSDQSEADVQRKAKPMAAALPAAEPARIMAVREEARIDNAAFQAVYIITEPQTIISSGAAKQVHIDTSTVVPELRIRTVPSRNAVAYLYAKFALDKTKRLLPGTIALFRDRTFVGRGRLPVLAGGEDHELGFGIDDAVRVKFITVARKSGEAGLISASRTDTRRFRVTVTNHHARKVTIRVIDHIPVSEDDEIQVDLLGAANSPSRKDLDGKRGVYAWDLDVGSQAEKQIKYGYRLSWPQKRKIRFYPPVLPAPAR